MSERGATTRRTAVAVRPLDGDRALLPLAALAAGLAAAGRLLRERELELIDEEAPQGVAPCGAKTAFSYEAHLGRPLAAAGAANDVKLDLREWIALANGLRPASVSCGRDACSTYDFIADLAMAARDPSSRRLSERGTRASARRAWASRREYARSLSGLRTLEQIENALKLTEGTKRNEFARLMRACV